jgi:transcription termination/antitermination protein NusA
MMIDFVMERNIGFKERRYIEELRILTKSTAIDCVIDERFCRVIYVIKKGDMGLAIGKKGDNIKRMQNVLGKRIEMVEYSDTIEEFVSNIFRPVEIGSVKKSDDGNRIDVFLTKKGDLGIAIGKGGCNIEKARILIRRFFATELGDVSCEGDAHE